MNLEKDLWNEDPTKAWMQEYQCNDWKNYLKNTVIPAVERHRGLLNSFYFSFEYKVRSFVQRRDNETFSTMPVNLLIGANKFLKWQLYVCMVQKSTIKLPVYLENNRKLQNIVDVEMGNLGERDIFFGIQANSKNGNVWVYFTPMHLEEACCIIKTRSVTFGLGKTVWMETVAFINQEGWDRLGSMNPFSVLNV